MLKTLSIFSLLFIFGCNGSVSTSDTETKNKQVQKQPVTKVDSTKITETKVESNVTINDTLNSIAQIIAGNFAEGNLFSYLNENKDYQNFSQVFNKRWVSFDTTRLQQLKQFESEKLAKDLLQQKTLFYPFSGPDILYAHTFFPQADNYIMIGLEPVGTLPKFTNSEEDSLSKYFNKINTSLNAILKFSFFRTESMSKDLKNTEVDGTLHLLFLFLNRTGNSIVSAKPVGIDSLGNPTSYSSFNELKKANLRTKGIKIEFLTSDKQLKTVTYYSLNAANDGLSKNKGFVTYLNSIKNFNTYLKGASYLLHKSNFSTIRNVIINGASSVIQDDSGIPYKFFEESKWNFKFYGAYTRPIPMFSVCYQKDLDSVWKNAKAEKTGFGIGYNFRDKNSNLMIATKK